MPWYCLQTHVKKEFIAQANCNNQGFETFLPTYMHNLPKKKIDVKRPLFSSYLFVKFDPENDVWFPLCHTIGVKKLFAVAPPISKADKSYAYIRPIPVPEHLIISLQQEIVEQPKSKTSVINPGLIVKVISGPFESHQGICTWSNEKRVALLLDVMNGRIKVSFSRENVELVCSQN